MPKTSWLIAFAHRALKDLLRSNRGNVALIFAITLVPMLAATGMVVDYTRAALARQQLQDALDSTALFLSKSANVSTMNQAQLTAAAQKYFNVNFTNRDVGTVTLTPAYSSTGPSVTVAGTTTTPSLFMGIVGVPSIPVSGTATAVWGHERLRVALVLDNTGSMSSSGKLAALKTATTGLLSQLQSAATSNGDVYVSIVPFVKDVNIGSSNYNQPYIAFDDASCDPTSSTCDGWWDGSNGSCNMNGPSRWSANSPRSVCLALGTCSISTYNNNQSGCLTAGTCSLWSYSTQNTCTAAAACDITSKTSRNSCISASGCFVNGTYKSGSSYNSSSKCSRKGGAWRSGTWSAGTWTAATWTNAVWKPASHADWNGCITDRGASPFSVGTDIDPGPGTAPGNDQTTTAPSDISTMLPAEQYDACPQAIMPLTYNWTALNALVTNMVANGSTNQPIGLVWGWRSLAGNGPLTAPAMDPAYQYKQVIILLSDGLNTQDRWYGNGSDTSTAVDNRMYYKRGNTVTGTCKNIKDEGIIVYTVQVNTGGDPTSTLLQNCASDPSKFFLLTSANAIITTFQSIGTALSSLRLSN